MLDLWLQPVDQASVAWAETNAAVLDEEELHRWRRYRAAESQELFAVAHVATRHVLSHYGERAPASWIFDHGENGRPEIVGGPPGLRFNLSHTTGMVAVLVHGNADCGVDVEYVRRPLDINSVSRRVFTQPEQSALFSLPTEWQADRFFHLWTLKEAFIKAKGKGLALPLKQFGFVMRDGDSTVDFACDPAIDPAPVQWQFFTHRPASGHIVSIAAQRGPADVEAPVVIRQLVL